MLRLPPLIRFIVLYATMYAAFGVASPFMPRFLTSRGLSPEQLGVLLALGTAVRIVSGPVAGRVADLSGALRAVLGLCTMASAGAALWLLAVTGFWSVLAVSLLQAAVLAPVTTLADALALNAAAAPGARDGDAGFEYGWVRGSASAAFVAGSLVAGQVLGRAALGAIVWMHGALLAGAAFATGLVPPLDPRGETETAEEQSPVGGVRELLRLPVLRRVVLVAALVLGSHAMHDGFAMLRWSAAGITPAAGSVLWSESVAAEVVVFFLVGPALLDRLGPGGAAALAALAGIVRWTTMAQTTALAALVLVQPLHGFTFALLHLASMRLIAATAPTHLAATAQAVYAFGAAAATAMLSLAAGTLYARFGAHGFLAMALLCAVALPLTAGLRTGARRAPGPPGSSRRPRRRTSRRDRSR